MVLLGFCGKMLRQSVHGAEECWMVFTCSCCNIVLVCVLNCFPTGVEILFIVFVGFFFIVIALTRDLLVAIMIFS